MKRKRIRTFAVYSIMLFTLFAQTSAFAKSSVGYVTASVLNIRTAPSTDAQINARLVYNDQVIIVDERDGWLEIKYGLYTGFVKSNYITENEEFSTSAILSSIPEEEICTNLKIQSENVYFYDDIQKEFTNVQKDFYWIKLASGARRFDSKIPAIYFEQSKDYEWTPSVRLKMLCNNMAEALFKSSTSISVNSYYGQYYPNKTNNNAVTYATGIHEGIDFGGPDKNCAFYSLTDGVVASVHHSQTNENYSWISVRAGNYQVFYVHGDTFSAKVGDSIVKGQKLGTQGDKGAAGAFHVHVELKSVEATSFSYSKDTILSNSEPYSFWETLY